MQNNLKYNVALMDAMTDLLEAIKFVLEDDDGGMSCKAQDMAKLSIIKAENVKAEKIMTAEEFEEKMIILKDMNDYEEAHIQADNLMCEILKSYGYEKGVILFNLMNKWYA